MEHVNNWCCRDFYKCGLWEDDLVVCAHRAEIVGHRHINITRNAIGPKSGQKDCRKF